jgi:hypothetical protein
MRRATLGFMIGCMAGACLAVGSHLLLNAQPQLAAGVVGRVLAWLSAPGANLLAALTPLSTSHESGMLAHWISLQLTLLLGGGFVGTLMGILTEQRRHPAPTGDDSR